MSIYRFSLSTIKRSAGRNAAATVAYRTGERCHSRRLGSQFDYRRRSTGVVAKHFINWSGTSEEFADAMEDAEKRKDSVISREIQIALPHELGARWRESLAVDYAEWLYHRFGVAVLVCVHLPNSSGDKRNHHAHLLMTTRKVDERGRFSTKTVELDNRRTGCAAVEEMRQEWATRVNALLQRMGKGELVDHRSNFRRGIAYESESQTRGALELGARGETIDRVERVSRRKMRNLHLRKCTSVKKPLVPSVKVSPTSTGVVTPSRLSRGHQSSLTMEERNALIMAYRLAQQAPPAREAPSKLSSATHSHRRTTRRQ